MKDPYDPYDDDGIDPYRCRGISPPDHRTIDDVTKEIWEHRALEAEKKLKELEEKIVSWIAGFMDDQGEPHYATMIREGKWKEGGGKL